MNHWFFVSRDIMWFFVGSAPIITASSNPDAALPALLFQWGLIAALYFQVIQ